MSVEDFLSSRFAALGSGDFSAVYATYHEDSPFIRQFSGCREYVDFAQQQLCDIKVTSWQSLRSRQPAADRCEHLLVIELAVAETRQYFYELALLINTPDGWRYHSAQKLSVEDYPGPPEQIQFAHFDQRSEKLRY